MQAEVLFCACLFVSTNIQGAHSYSSGADSTSCETMIPIHDSFKPQASASLYEIQLSSNNTLKGYEPVKVTLKVASGSPKHFKGFLIQVRKQGGANAVGQFTIDPGAGGSTKLLDCMIKGASVTHTSGDKKTQVQVSWIPPNEDGVYEVYYTVVEDKSTFWSHVVHPQEIKVKKNASAKTTTARPPIKSTWKPHDKLLAKWKDIYNGCGKKKGCFGLPNGCISSYDSEASNPKTCEVLVTWKINDQGQNDFELTGRPSDTMQQQSQGYVAVGLSTDGKMGDDSVVGCTVSSASTQNPSPKIERYFNQGYDNEKYSDPDLGLKAVSSSAIEGYLFCKFIQTNHKIHSVDVNFEKPYHRMLSRASIVSDTALGKHTRVEDRGVTRNAIDMTDYLEADMSDDIGLVQLHGSFMLCAWIPFASCSVIIARFFKDTHVGNLVMGSPVWLILHVSLMVVTSLLTLTGIGLMIYKNEGIYELGATTHSILGLCVVALGIPQGILPLFRYMSWAPRKLVFSWCHFLVARFIQILAYGCILLAVDLDLAELQNGWAWWIGLAAATILVQIVMHGVMTYHTYWADGVLGVEPEFRYRAIHIGPLRTNGMAVEAPGKSSRYLMMLFYAAILTCMTALMIVVIYHKI